MYLSMILLECMNVFVVILLDHVQEILTLGNYMDTCLQESSFVLHKI